MNHILTGYNESHNDIVKAIHEFKPTILEQINELEKLLLIGASIGKKRKFPHIVKSRLAAILADEKTSPGSPVFAYKKSQLTKIAFELFRDEKGKKFTKKESFHTMLNQRCKYNPKEGVIVKDYLQINKDVIDTF
ncbi:MAG: hypothetical protein IPM69_13735 [Ignavibacteria bacterium]|nr:hypothetical protein [Ignavibacteria bacterium]